MPQRLIAGTVRENRSVENREDGGHVWETKNQYCDLDGNHRIVGMRQELIGSSRREGPLTQTMIRVVRREPSVRITQKRKPCRTR